MTDDEILSRVTDVIRDTLKGAASIPLARREWTAPDVPGWNSLSHAVLILNIESEFGIELPLVQTLEANSLGDLVDIIRNQVSHGRGAG